MGDRFRLIYLKSLESERDSSEEEFLSDHSEKTSDTNRSAPINKNPETFSERVFFQQAKEDLKHPDPKVRILAIQYLERCDPAVAIPLLEAILPDRDSNVRTQAVSSLTKFRPLVASMLKKCLKDNDAKVRIVALRGLFHAGQTIDLNILVQCLSDESSLVRRKMATLLGWTQYEGVFPILVELSRDRNSKVRKAALSSLVTLYPGESEEKVLEAMRDPEPDLRKWARRTLEKMALCRKRPFSIKPDEAIR